MDETNLELLCWNCHMLEHFKHKDGPYKGGINGRKAGWLLDSLF
jgi:hypothetical protein